MDIAELLNRKPLPAISTEQFDLHFPGLSTSCSQPETRIAPDEEFQDTVRAYPYTIADDLSMLKVVASYYGYKFTGKIPWSFWQTYKRVTGSTRSNSSLYHHWNGSMRKKYERYIESGNLRDCIQQLEEATMFKQYPPYPPLVQVGMPLSHSVSGPSVPLVALPSFDSPYEQPRLIRATSFSGVPLNDLQWGFHAP